MSTISNEINHSNVLTSYIKLENDSDDEITNDKSLELNNKIINLSNLSSTSTNLHPSLASAYKGKIEVTSKGRRKIFDGVRWQILCRRPECRKQTNKKSLCITHYKEEYEHNTQSSSSTWSNNLQSFHASSYQKQHSLNVTKNRTDIEDQNNTISTTNLTDNDEQTVLNSFNDNRSTHEGQIEYTHNGKRFVFRNSKWEPLCKYNNICHNVAKNESLCIKHYELRLNKRRDSIKHIHNINRRFVPSSFNNQRSIFSNDFIKRMKKTHDVPTSSSSTSITEQFDVHSNETNHMSTEPIENDCSSVTSKKTSNTITSNYSLFDKQNFEVKNDQSVQTDLSIPFCCLIHQENHSFYSSCEKSTSSISSHNTKSEPQSFDKNFST